MIVVSQLACSPEFTAALAAVENGKTIRRASWPEGMNLRKKDGQIAVYRNEKFTAPAWMGPSSDEADATDWEILEPVQP